MVEGGWLLIDGQQVWLSWNPTITVTSHLHCDISQTYLLKSINAKPVYKSTSGHAHLYDDSPGSVAAGGWFCVAVAKVAAVVVQSVDRTRQTVRNVKLFFNKRGHYLCR